MTNDQSKQLTHPTQNSNSNTSSIGESETKYIAKEIPAKLTVDATEYTITADTSKLEFPKIQIIQLLKQKLRVCTVMKNSPYNTQIKSHLQ